MSMWSKCHDGGVDVLNLLLSVLLGPGEIEVGSRKVNDGDDSNN